MKKFFAIVMLVAMLLTSIPAFAVVAENNYASANVSKESVGVGDTFEMIISTKEISISSFGISLTCSENISVVSGEWLISGLIASFDALQNKAAFAPGGTQTFSGDIFRFTFKTTEESVEPSDIDVTVIAKNGSNVLYEETITKSVTVADTAPTFVATDAAAAVGETFDVDIKIKNNPGIVSFQLLVSYDTDTLELVSAQNGVFNNMNYGATSAQPYAINWVDTLHPNNTTNGVVATLTFRVKDSAEAGNTQINISYDPENVYDYDFENVTFAVKGAIVSISEKEAIMYGDADGNGIVNTRDIILIRKYVADKDPFTGESSIAVMAGADSNGDGVINTKDIILVRKYVADKDPITGESSVVLGPEKK